MWCGMCIKWKTKRCPKKITPRRMTRACTQFVFSTRKVPANTLREAIRLSKMPKTQVMALMSLLDSGLRLKGQKLSLGLTVDYDRLPETKKVYLISSPKRDPYAYGVCFSDVPKKNTVISVTIDKQKFYKERDLRLREFWEKLEEKFIGLNDPNLKKKILLKIFNRLGKDYVEFMLNLNGIKILVKGRKINEVVNELLKSYI